MSHNLEEKLREAAAIGDVEGLQILLAQNVDVNSKNAINGWTALHWACKRNQEQIVHILLNHGADSKLENQKGERPSNLCTNQSILNLLEPPNIIENSFNEDINFTPNYIKMAPLNGQVDLGTNKLRREFLNSPIGLSSTALPCTSLPSTILPSTPLHNTSLHNTALHNTVLNNTALPSTQNTLQNQSDDLVLKIRIYGSNDPDFIEVELPKWKLTYNTLLKICCEELEISESQVERIRKLPNVRLRKDSDVKRLTDFQCLEIVLKAGLGDKVCNSYQSISAHKDQTILY